MKRQSITFSKTSTDFFFNGNISGLRKIVTPRDTILLTDENVFRAHKAKFRGWNCIILKPGEEYKTQSTIDSIVDQLVAMEAGRSTRLVGVGGGVITDIVGYVAAVYMRGLDAGFVPTSLLAMVDAAIGGKNGVNVEVYKNLVGTIRQPSFVLYDLDFLKTLPGIEWSNGFAEIIKHACIANFSLFKKLEHNNPDTIRGNKTSLREIIQVNALFKAMWVKADEFEKGPRQLLNFGHTIGHALENQYELSHGQAISIGMVLACHISEQVTGFNETERVVSLLEKYQLPTYARFNLQKVMDVLRMDKKRERQQVNFIVLEKLGKATVRPLSLKKIERILNEL